MHLKKGTSPVYKKNLAALNVRITIIQVYANVGRRTGREVGGTRVTINSPVFARLPREIIGCYMIVTPCGTSLADGIIHRYTRSLILRQWKPIPTFSILVNGPLIYYFFAILVRWWPTNVICDIPLCTRERRKDDAVRKAPLNWNVTQRMLIKSDVRRFEDAPHLR